MAEAPTVVFAFAGAAALIAFVAVVYYLVFHKGDRGLNAADTTSTAATVVVEKVNELTQVEKQPDAVAEINGGKKEKQEKTTLDKDTKAVDKTSQYSLRSHFQSPSIDADSEEYDSDHGGKSPVTSGKNKVPKEADDEGKSVITSHSTVISPASDTCSKLTEHTVAKTGPTHNTFSGVSVTSSLKTDSDELTTAFSSDEDPNEMLSRSPTYPAVITLPPELKADSEYSTSDTEGEITLTPSCPASPQTVSSRANETDDETPRNSP